MDNPELLIVAIALVFNLGGLVWGAALIKGTVDGLSRELERLRATVEGVQRFISKLDTRLTVLESRNDPS